MKRLNLFFIKLLAIACLSPVFAQMPSMTFESATNTATPAVTLNKMDIEVEIFGNIAVTTMKMVFYNNTSRVLEGELTFPMPDGVAVSRFALDIDEELRDAVPVARTKATEVFESIEQRRVDPGLLERVEGNNFRTRVYPLWAKDERTVLVAYEENLTFNSENAMQYHLPLDYPDSIQEFSLQVKAYRAAQKPQITEQPDSGFSFSFAENSHVYEASMQRTGFRPTKALTVNLPKDTDTPETAIQQNTDGSYYFLINAYPQNGDRPKKWSNRIGIIWDNSMSGLSRDKNKELELLDKIITQKRNLTVELGLLNITFRKAKTFTVRNGDWSELKSYLQNLTYDGGTDFSCLNERTLKANEYLLFSDGLSTFGQNEIRINKPVHTVCSSMKADFNSLKAVSYRTGGKYINLAGTTVENAFKQINRNSLQFLGVQAQSDVMEVYPSMPTETNGHIAVTGIVRALPDEITLLFGRNGKVEARQKVKLQPGNTDMRIDRVWAQMKIAGMDVQYEQNREEIESLGQQFGIVTRNTSLLVLEDIEDYVRYEITPPAELLSEYGQLIENGRIEKEKRVNNMLERAVAKVEELKKWWKDDFDTLRRHPTIKEEIVRRSEEESRRAEQSRLEELEEITRRLSLNLYGAQPLRIQPETVQTERSETIYTITRLERPQSAQIARITISEIKSDKDYIEKISSATDPYAEYLILRETYMGTPGFFFDVSDFFYKNNQNEVGLLVLSCLAELEIENSELFKALAYKLKERGLFEKELYITRKIREWRPMDPQSHRDYALALQNNGRYQEALDYLYSILNASYSPEAAARDLGIEEVVVCEINNLISLHKSKLNLSAVNL